MMAPVKEREQGQEREQEQEQEQASEQEQEPQPQQEPQQEQESTEKQKPEPKMSPIDRFFTTVLSWLSAYYALEAARQKADESRKAAEGLEAKPKNAIPGSKGRLAARLAARKRDREAIKTHASTSSAQGPTAIGPSNELPALGLDPTAKPSLAQLEALAKNLETHEAMLDLLNDLLDPEVQWPGNDRHEESKQLLKLNKAKEQVPKGTRQSKRDSSAMGGQSNGRPSKRNKP